MATRSYNRVTTDEVMKLYNRDYNHSQIARELGCCRNTVLSRIRAYAVKNNSYIYISSKPIRSGYCPLTICDMRQDGLSVVEIAATSGLSKSYIYKVLKDYTDANR